MNKPTKPLQQWQIDDAGRLKHLFSQRTPQISQAEFGDKYGIGTQGMVWQYLAGRRPLNIEAAVAFARGLGVGIVDFSPTIATQIRAASQAVDPPGSHSKSTSLTSIQRTNESETELLEMYRLMDEEIWQPRLIEAARSFPKLALLIGSRNQA